MAPLVVHQLQAPVAAALTTVDVVIITKAKSAPCTSPGFATLNAWLLCIGAVAEQAAPSPARPAHARTRLHCIIQA